MYFSAPAAPGVMNALVTLLKDFGTSLRPFNTDDSRCLLMPITPKEM